MRTAAKIAEIDARIAGLRRIRDELARIVGCACDSVDRCTCRAAYLVRRGHEQPVTSTRLHVTNGESAANTLRQTSIGGAVLPWRDALHEGPVRPGLPLIAKHSGGTGRRFRSRSCATVRRSSALTR